MSYLPTRPRSTRIVHSLWTNRTSRTIDATTPPATPTRDRNGAAARTGRPGGRRCRCAGCGRSLGGSARDVHRAPSQRARPPSGCRWPPPFDRHMPGAAREAHLPTEHPPPGPQARVSRPDAHPGRPFHPQGPAAQGPHPSVGLIGRIHERREFERLSRHGRRARSETLWCRYLDDPPVVPPRVAFAIGRDVGPAVTRNRLRRRLRVHRRPVAGALLPHGQLLVGARPGAGERSFDELGAELTAMLTRSVRRRSS